MAPGTGVGATLTAVGALNVTNAAAVCTVLPSWRVPRVADPRLTTPQSSARGETPVIVVAAVTMPGTSIALSVPSPKGVAPPSAMKRTSASEPIGPKPVPVIVNATGMADVSGV